MLTEKAANIIKSEWATISGLAAAGKLKDWLEDPKLIKAVNLSVNSRIKTYRYVLPTQIVAKLADPSLDSHCLQAARGGQGAFDARTVAHTVTVPFDQANEGVLVAPKSHTLTTRCAFRRSRLDTVVPRRIVPVGTNSASSWMRLRRKVTPTSPNACSDRF